MVSKRSLADKHNTTIDLVNLRTSTGTFYTVSKSTDRPLYVNGVGYLHDTVTQVTMSYNTIIGARVGHTSYRTTTKYSVTTSKHTNLVASTVGLTESDLYHLVKQGAYCNG